MVKVELAPKAELTAPDREMLGLMAKHENGAGTIEPMPDPDQWTPAELQIMAQRGQYIFPNRKVAREMWLESLRLAVEISPKPGDHRWVLETARMFEGYLTGKRNPPIDYSEILEIKPR